MRCNFHCSLLFSSLSIGNENAAFLSPKHMIIQYVFHSVVLLRTSWLIAKDTMVDGKRNWQADDHHHNCNMMYIVHKSRAHSGPTGEIAAYYGSVPALYYYCSTRMRGELLVAMANKNTDAPPRPLPPPPHPTPTIPPGGRPLLSFVDCRYVSIRWTWSTAGRWRC